MINEKKIFEVPECKIERFEAEDILTTSGCESDQPCEFDMGGF